MVSSWEPVTPLCLSPGHCCIGCGRLQPGEHVAACSPLLLFAPTCRKALPALVLAGITPVVAFCIVSFQSYAEILLLFPLK